MTCVSRQFTKPQALGAKLEVRLATLRPTDEMKQACGVLLSLNMLRV